MPGPAITTSNVTGTANGLNQLTGVGPKSLTHDAKGNVTAFGTKSLHLLQRESAADRSQRHDLAYDPLMRLYQTGRARRPAGSPMTGSTDRRI